ncbi:MAG: SUF system NifU family Fe-S cluster assembly protein [Firmicutes bacterium]|nr:SUF system NifU family Fe-S cluster assembly protein [Bacillota bacterium]
MSLSDLYQEVILDHYRAPRNRGRLPDATVSLNAENPLCGDELRLDLDVQGDRIANILFEGRGCSISLASASMMTELVKGGTLSAAREAIARFKAMLRSGEEDEALGDATALVGVSKFPVRVKCATLAWTALEQALDELSADRAR